MISIPQGYSLLQKGPATIVVKSSYRDVLLDQGIADPESMLQRYSGINHYQRGRDTAPAIQIEGSADEKMVIRKYLRGGLMRFVNRNLYIGPDRPFNELRVTVEASSKGIPTADILAAVSIKSASLLYRGYLFSKELSSCCDLSAYLKECLQNHRATFSNIKKQLLQKAAGLISAMHDNGLYHGDLNLKNILINRLNPEQMYIIDWDKSRAQQCLDSSERRANVLRFCRSMAKHSGSGLPLTERDRLFFLENYWKDITQAQRDLKKLRISLAVRNGMWKISNSK